MLTRHPRFARTILQAFLVCLSLPSSSCLHRPRPKDAPTVGPDYVDLKIGWRLRVVVPLLRSGGYIVPTTVEREEGKTIEVKAGADFIGYETDYYSVKSHAGGVTVSFTNAETVEEGKSFERMRPMLPLFNMPSGMRFVRLIYLIRESKSDHNMVIIAAVDKGVLKKLTVSVTSGDSSMCRSPQYAACVEVPTGIAVVPEERIPVDGKADWRPAR